MAGLEFWQCSYVVFPALVLFHLYVSPYTKVEESFNIQATHDILKYGMPTQNIYWKLKAQYDHMTFPGAVPRTFIGSLVLAAVARPFILFRNLDGEQQQFLVRAILGLFNAGALITYASGVKRAYGAGTSAWYMILQSCQFHIFYYASRPLPNTFAFGIVTLALRCFLPATSTPGAQVKRTRLGIYLLTLAAVVFRAEVGVLLASYSLYMLLKPTSLDAALRLARTVLLPAILSATVAGLLLTVTIDTYFWQSTRWLWPELAAFVSNIFPSKGSLGASAWGTSPYHWYLTSALPRLFLNPVLLILLFWGLSATLRPAICDLVVPSFTYITLYSALPHKETRFIFYVVPPITGACALCANYVSVRRARSKTSPILFFSLICTSIVAGLSCHGVLLPLSAKTYPGANALSSLHQISLNYSPQPVLRVHLTNLALQTGVTHFLETPSSAKNKLHDRPVFTLPGSADGRRPTIHSKHPTMWLYDRSDNQTEFLTPQFWGQFDYVVVEEPGRVIGTWDVVDRIPAFGKPTILDPNVGRGMLAWGPKPNRRQDDGLSRLLEATYGARVKWIYGMFHDVLREGAGFQDLLGPGWSWTKGWWVHWGLETKLYVLKRANAGSSP